MGWWWRRGADENATWEEIDIHTVVDGLTHTGQGKDQAPV
jgi:hypothetical protein